MYSISPKVSAPMPLLLRWAASIAYCVIEQRKGQLRNLLGRRVTDMPSIPHIRIHTPVSPLGRRIIRCGEPCPSPRHLVAALEEPVVHCSRAAVAAAMAVMATWAQIPIAATATPPTAMATIPTAAVDAGIVVPEVDASPCRHFRRIPEVGTAAPQTQMPIGW